MRCTTGNPYLWQPEPGKQPDHSLGTPSGCPTEWVHLKLRVFGDAGYLGIQKRDEHKDRQNVSWFIAKRPGSRKKLDDRKLKAEKLKASARAKVEHPFRYIKQVFGYSNVRYRGLAKNSNRLHLLAAFSNLLMGEKYLLS